MKEKWQLAIFAAAVSLVASAATFRVAAPDGSVVCTVTPPDYGPGAVLETTNLTGCVAWRVRFTGMGERTIEKEEWTFDFGEDFRCWPVSHAQGEYIPKTLSTIATMKPMPGAAAIAAGKGHTQNYWRTYPGTAESPLVVEGNGWVAALGDAGVIDYATRKGVGVILYVNRDPLKKNRDAILDLLASWGVKGIKYGFLHVGDQSWRKWATEAIETAAKRKLMVDIHDEYRLTGIQKTYPNVMTVEGICGNEEMPNAAHDCALPFTRFLDGPSDYTPCWNQARVKNTLAHQLALPCVYTSGWQFLFWYSRPEQINEKDPALDFWREIPCAFDETRFLQGKIGEYAVSARRMKSGDVFSVDAAARGGFALIVEKAKTGQ